MAEFFDEVESKFAQIPEDSFEAISPTELGKQTKAQIKTFVELLNSLDTSLDKKKQLWKLIFENAVTDRKNAYLVFADLYVAVHQHPEQHAIHGPTLSKYMERMSKATDQLLKLAELVAVAEDKIPKEVDERMDDDDIYSSIQSKKKQ
jgi:predicted secreted Zn-dependent protease